MCNAILQKICLKQFFPDPSQSESLSGTGFHDLAPFTNIFATKIHALSFQIQVQFH